VESEFLGSYLHLDSLQGIIMTLPMEPDNTFGVLKGRTFQVKTVEVAVMTGLVPPGTGV